MRPQFGIGLIAPVSRRQIHKRFFLNAVVVQDVGMSASVGEPAPILLGGGEWQVLWERGVSGWSKYPLQSASTRVAEGGRCSPSKVRTGKPAPRSVYRLPLI
jgi:hypothetical protein